MLTSIIVVYECCQRDMQHDLSHQAVQHYFLTNNCRRITYSCFLVHTGHIYSFCMLWFVLLSLILHTCRSHGPGHSQILSLRDKGWEGPGNQAKVRPLIKLTSTCSNPIGRYIPMRIITPQINPIPTNQIRALNIRGVVHGIRKSMHEKRGLNLKLTRLEHCWRGSCCQILCMYSLERL